MWVFFPSISPYTFLKNFSVFRDAFLKDLKKRFFLFQKTPGCGLSPSSHLTLLNLKRQKERDDARIQLKLEILKKRVASLTRSCCGHLSVSTAALPILEIFQLVVIKQTWALSSSVCNCLVTLFQVNIISYSLISFSLSLSLALFDARGGGMSAGRQADA